MPTPAKFILHQQTQVQHYFPIRMQPGREAHNEHIHSQNLKSAQLSSATETRRSFLIQLFPQTTKTSERIHWVTF